MITGEIGKAGLPRASALAARPSAVTSYGSWGQPPSLLEPAFLVEPHLHTRRAQALADAQRRHRILRRVDEEDGLAGRYGHGSGAELEGPETPPHWKTPPSGGESILTGCPRRSLKWLPRTVLRVGERRTGRRRHPAPRKQHHARVPGRAALVVVELRDQEFDGLGAKQVVALVDSGDAGRQGRRPPERCDRQGMLAANRPHSRRRELRDGTHDKCVGSALR